jgi:autotransporter passenger strand-loop-strand repeat protein
VDGGTVVGAIVSVGGLQLVDLSRVSDTTIESGGSQIIKGAIATNTIVSSGGSQVVSGKQLLPDITEYGQANATTVYIGGIQLVSAAG